MSIIFFVLIAIITLLYFWVQRYSYYLTWKLKGVIGYPFLGGILSLKKQHEVLDALQKMEKEHKSPYVLWMGPRCVVVSSDPETNETILTNPNFVNKNFVYNFLRDLIGDGLFTSNVPVWNTRIKVVKPSFKKKMILGFYKTFNVMSQLLIDETERNLTKKNFNFFLSLQMAALKATCYTTLGDTRSNVEKADYDSLLKSVSGIMNAVVDRTFQPLYYTNSIYKFTKHYHDAFNKTDYVHSFVTQKILSKINEKKVSQNMEDVEKDYMAPMALLDFILENEHNLSIEEIRNEVVVLIAAGFETTAISLYICVLCITMHQEVQDRLFEELQQVMPCKDTYIEEEHMKQLTYTEQCINEAMRVVAPVPVVGRSAMDNIKLQNGIKLPKGTDVFLDIFNLQRSEKHWGPDAKKYDPERFSPANLKTVHPYAYIPFTKGSRMCVGFKYSITLMKIFLAKIFRSYRVTCDKKFEELIFIENISIKIKEHPKFCFEKRAE